MTEATVLTVNMHRSQISHGYVAPDAFTLGDLLHINLGYTPSMVRLFCVNEGAATITGWIDYYMDNPNVMYLTRVGSYIVADTAIEVVDGGFVVDTQSLSEIPIAFDRLEFEAFGPYNFTAEAQQAYAPSFSADSGEGEENGEAYGEESPL